MRRSAMAGSDWPALLAARYFSAVNQIQEADKFVLHLHVRHVDAGMNRSSNGLAEHGLHLEGAALFEVDHHGGPIVAHGGGLGEHLVDHHGCIDAATAGVARGDRLGHEASCQFLETGVVHDPLRADDAGRDRQAVERDVPDELLPARLLERGGSVRLDTGLGEHGSDRAGLVGVIQKVAEGDAPVGTVVDDAGLATVDANKGEAAEDALGAEPLSEFLLDTEAVHQRQDERVRTDTGAYQFLGLVQRGCFEGAEDEVDSADLLGLLIGLGGDVEISIATDDVESTGPYGLKVSPHNKVDIVSDTRQSSPVEAADGARPDHGDFDSLSAGIWELKNSGIGGGRRNRLRHWQRRQQR